MESLLTLLRDFEIRTGNALASASALASPVVVASGTLPQGPADNSGQRIDGLALRRFVQIAGLNNYGAASAHGLGAVAFVRTAAAEPPANLPPVLVAPPPQIGSVGAPGNLALSASDPNSDRLVFGAVGLPTGLALDPNTGLVSGSFTAEGVFQVEVSVSDGRGGLDTAAFDWTVLAAQPPDLWMNDQVTVVYARGNPCGTDTTTLGSRCAAWLLPKTGLTFDDVVFENSTHTGGYLQAFVSNSSGTALANLIFDLGTPDLANSLILWNYTGSKTSSQLRDFQVFTSDTLAANGTSLENPVLVTSGSLPIGTADNSGQRFNGLGLLRYVQIVGVSNHGSSSTNGLGRVGFVRD